LRDGYCIQSNIFYTTIMKGALITLWSLFLILLLMDLALSIEGDLQQVP